LAGRLKPDVDYEIGKAAADLGGSETVIEPHVAEALRFRPR
jgi:predicted ATPase with chaperone activity